MIINASEREADEAWASIFAYSTLISIGAVDRNRTYDLLITNQLLYQLSYNGVFVGRGV